MSSESEEDYVLRQKVEIDNKVCAIMTVDATQVRLTSLEDALERLRETIRLDSSLPWTETLTVTYPETIEVDVEDDLQQELALYVSCNTPIAHNRFS